MDVKPDFERIRKAARFEEADRVPLAESLIDYSIQSQFLGRPVTPDDLAFGNGPMISPQAFRDHVFPWYHEIANRCHEKDRLGGNQRWQKF